MRLLEGQSIKSTGELHEDTKRGDERASFMMKHSFGVNDVFERNYALGRYANMMYWREEEIPPLIFDSLRDAVVKIVDVEIDDRTATFHRAKQNNSEIQTNMEYRHLIVSYITQSKIDGTIQFCRSSMYDSTANIGWSRFLQPWNNCQCRRLALPARRQGSVGHGYARCLVRPRYRAT